MGQGVNTGDKEKGDERFTLQFNSDLKLEDFLTFIKGNFLVILTRRLYYF